MTVATRTSSRVKPPLAAFHLSRHLHALDFRHAGRGVDLHGPARAFFVAQHERHARRRAAGHQQEPARLVAFDRDSLRHVERAIRLCLRRRRYRRPADSPSAKSRSPPASSRRSTRFIAEVRKLAAEPEAEDSRTLGEARRQGREREARDDAMIITTTSISISVTPDWILLTSLLTSS